MQCGFGFTDDRPGRDGHAEEKNKKKGKEQQPGSQRRGSPTVCQQPSNSAAKQAQGYIIYNNGVGKGRQAGGSASAFQVSNRAAS